MQAELKYIQENVRLAEDHTESTESVALVFTDGSTGTCPTTWVHSGQVIEDRIVMVDWQGDLWEATILKISGKYNTVIKFSQKKN